MWYSDYMWYSDCMWYLDYMWYYNLGQVGYHMRYNYIACDIPLGYMYYDQVNKSWLI